MGRISKEVLMELDVPEEVTIEDVRMGLKRVGEKYLKITRINIKPLLDLIEEHGFEVTRRMVEKAYLREKLLAQETDSSGNNIPRRAIFRGDKLVGQQAIVPGHGAVTLQTYELTPSHVRLLAGVYRSACNFAQQAGGDAQLIASCREEAERLESSIEPDEITE